MRGEDQKKEKKQQRKKNKSYEVNRIHILTGTHNDKEKLKMYSTWDE